MNQRFTDLVQETKTRIQEIDTQTVKNKLENNDVFYLIDIREVDEYAQGHLPNANHITKGVLELKIEQLTNDPSAEIVVYCGGGSRSALAADALQKMGYTNVFSLAGGFRGWHHAGY